MFNVDSKSRSCNFIEKETPAQVFSCEFCEIFKNTFFIEHSWWLILTSVVQCDYDKLYTYLCLLGLVNFMI